MAMYTVNHATTVPSPFRRNFEVTEECICFEEQVSDLYNHAFMRYQPYRFVCSSLAFSSLSNYYFKYLEICATPNKIAVASVAQPPPRTLNAVPVDAVDPRAW